MKLLVSGATKAVRHWHAKRPDRVGVLLRPGAGVVRDMVESMPVASDNGCFGGLDPTGWLRLLAELVRIPSLSWVTAPDVVADWRATLKGFDLWWPVLRSLNLPVAFVGQDGQDWVSVPWDRIECYFVGGSDAWKLSDESSRLVNEAKARGKLVHMGRVNTLERFMIAAKWGCHTADGSSFSKWSDILIPKAVRWIDAALGGPLYAEAGV